MVELAPANDQLLQLYRTAAADLGTDDLVIVWKVGKTMKAHKREKFVADLPAYRDKFSRPARAAWVKELARGEGGAAFFWLVTITAERKGMSECCRIRLLAPVAEA